MQSPFELTRGKVQLPKAVLELMELTGGEEVFLLPLES
jgi:hypothetical protein